MMTLNRDEYVKATDAIRGYLEIEFNLEIGSVATDQFMKFLEENVIHLYEDQAIEKVRQLVEEKAWSVDEDIRALKGIKNK